MALNKLWGESFDWIGSNADLTMRWPLGATVNGIGAPASAPFGTGQYVSQFQGQRIFDDASNQTTLYATVRLRYNSGTSTAGNYWALSFNDGTSNQVTIMWNGDGSIVVRSGSVSGTVLGTYTSKFTLNAWSSFQVKVIINNSTGEVHIRKDGDTTTEIVTLTGANTRAGTTNAYANRVQATSNSNVWFTDDFFGRSDDWCGDLRCFERTAKDMATSAVFSQNVSSVPFNPYASTGFTTSTGNGNVYYLQFVVTKPGPLNHVVLQFNASATGHVKVAIYDNAGGGGTPGNLIGGASDAVTNPGTGNVQFDWSTGVPNVLAGTYFLAINSDVAITLRNSGNTGFNNYGQASAYGSFPPTVGTLSTIGGNNSIFFAYQIVSANWSLIGEQQQDGDTTYIYSNNPTDAERYDFVALPTTAYAITCVNFCAIARKTDAGTRTAKIDFENSGTITAAGTFTPTTSYALYEFVTVNDATGTAWTPTTVNASTAGPEIVT